MRTIAERPNEPLPYLVFADWLQEHGEDEWAAIIRAEWDASRSSGADRDVPSPTRLLQKRWLSGLPWWIGRNGTVFHRGVPNMVRVKDIDAWLSQSEEPYRSLPTVRGISIRRHAWARWTGEPEVLLGSRHLERIAILDLSGCVLSGPFTITLARWPGQLPGLRCEPYSFPHTWAMPADVRDAIRRLQARMSSARS